MVTFRVATRFLAITALFGLMACGSKAPEAAKSPEEAAQRVVDGLKGNKPVALWDALPASYQKDVQGLITEFASKMDAEVYDKAMGVAAKGVKVMKDKKDLILGLMDSPMGGALPMPKDQIKNNFSGIVDSFGALMDSDIKTISSLKGMDVRKFLDKTGSKLMSQGMNMAKGQMPVKFEDIKVEKGGAEGMVKITVAGKTEELKFVQVEGKWIPEPMSKMWKAGIEEAKKNMGDLGDIAKNKDMVLKQLDQADKMLDALSKAEKPEDLMKAMGGM